MPKDEEIRNIQARRLNLFYLMQRYLIDNGLYGTAAALTKEARLSEDYELCDNIDLDAMYLEFASYYQLKFGKFPKFLKKTKPPVKLEVSAKRKKTKGQVGAAAVAAAAVAALKDTAPTKQENQTDMTFDVNELQVTVKKMETTVKRDLLPKDTNGHPAEPDTLEKKRPQDHTALQRLQEVQHGSNSQGGDQLLTCQEWQNLADLVKSTILNDDLKLKWSDICGNSVAIDIIKEAVVMPLKYPQLFNNGLNPWKSVLLHGPPGSGKTLLAKVLYNETRSMVTFFNITSSIVVSKWRGESEKLLKVLFYLAQRHAPSIIFFDEIEGLTSKRDRSSDHESSKRFKNELLQLMDGMEHHSTLGVFILASTNLPWEIDDAFLRRFEKKLLVQLPNETERANLIGKLLPISLRLTEEQMAKLVLSSLNFTGDEIRLACKEIAMSAVRKITRGKGNEAAAGKSKDEADIPLELAFKQIKPLSLFLMEKHSQWQKEHGS